MNGMPQAVWCASGFLGKVDHMNYNNVNVCLCLCNDREVIIARLASATKCTMKFRANQYFRARDPKQHERNPGNYLRAIKNKLCAEIDFDICLEGGGWPECNAFSGQRERERGWAP